MPLVTSKEMLLKAQEGGYAVGAFNAENMEMVKAIIQAAEELKAPVMIQTTPSTVKYGTVETYEIAPEDFGFKTVDLAELQGGTAAENAEITRAILSGEERGAKREIVLLNAGAALYIGGKAESTADGIILAKEAIDSGKAAEVLGNLVNYTK